MKKNTYFEIWIYNVEPGFFRIDMKNALSTLKQFSVAAIFLMVLTGTSFAQAIPSSQVPTSVQNASQKHCSGDISWNLGPKGVYEARFNKAGTEYVYVYSKTGQLSVKKKAINSILMPNSINTDLASNHSSYSLKEVFQVMNRAKEKYYEVHATNVSGSKRMRYSLAGSYVSSVDLKTSEAGQTLVASNVEVPTTTTAPAPVSTGGMRGESDGFDDMELIDDDIADLFEEEDDSDLFEDDLGGDDEDWEEIILEEEDDDFGDLEDWDIPEGDGF